MLRKTSLAAGIAAFATVALASGPLMADTVDYTAMTPAELAEYLVFETNSYNFDAEAQEGGSARQRMEQDEMQATCSVVGGGKPDAATLAALSAAARESISYPEGGITLGDWEKGRVLAWSGFGYRLAGASDDDHSRREPGALCYNCHQLATDRTGGSVAPVLTGYGKTRGTSEAILRFAYEIIYNPHAYFPCTHMPRFGSALTHDQILDVMAYLFDPESPVNE